VVLFLPVSLVARVCSPECRDLPLQIPRAGWSSLWNCFGLSILNFSGGVAHAVWPLAMAMCSSACSYLHFGGCHVLFSLPHPSSSSFIPSSPDVLLPTCSILFLLFFSSIHINTHLKKHGVPVSSPAQTFHVPNTISLCFLHPFVFLLWFAWHRSGGTALLRTARVDDVFLVFTCVVFAHLYLRSMVQWADGSGGDWAWN
jgi:hypothetical protein